MQIRNLQTMRIGFICSCRSNCIFCLLSEFGAVDLALDQLQFKAGSAVSSSEQGGEIGPSPQVLGSASQTSSLCLYPGMHWKRCIGTVMPSAPVCLLTMSQSWGRNGWNREHRQRCVYGRQEKQLSELHQAAAWPCSLFWARFLFLGCNSRLCWVTAHLEVCQPRPPEDHVLPSWLAVLSRTRDLTHCPGSLKFSIGAWRVPIHTFLIDELSSGFLLIFS